MIGTALTALLIMAILSLLQERRLITESRKDMLTTAVQSAHSIVVGYQPKAASGAMSVEDAQKAAKLVIQLRNSLEAAARHFNRRNLARANRLSQRRNAIKGFANRCRRGHGLAFSVEAVVCCTTAKDRWNGKKRRFTGRRIAHCGLG